MNMKPTDRVEIDYTNYRGERGRRIIVPRLIEFTSSQWHPEPQWVLQALDVEKNEQRSFAMKDVHSWKAIFELPEVPDGLTWEEVWGDLKPKDAFRAQLIQQEPVMWRSLAEGGKWPTEQDFKFICKRRGFDRNEREMVIRGLKAFGLWPLGSEPVGDVEPVDETHESSGEEKYEKKAAATKGSPRSGARALKKVSKKV